MELKNCSKCKQAKPLECFGKDKRASNGLRSQCKECEKIYKMNYEKKRDPAKKKLHAEKYRESHKEIEHNRLARWKENNPDKYQANKNYQRALRRGVEKQGDKDITLKKLYDRDKGICKLCGIKCDWTDIKINDNNSIVGGAYPSIDHIKPISRGGSHTWDNVQLAHHRCNSIKKDKGAI